MTVDVVASPRLTLGAGHPAERVRVRVDVIKVPIVVIRHLTQRWRLQARHFSLRISALRQDRLYIQQT